MANRSKRAIPRRDETKASSKPVGIVVRRGALRRFDKLTQKTADLPVVVFWDRRRVDGNENTGSANERRRKPPATWASADFVVLDGAPTSEQGARNLSAAVAKRKQAIAKKKRRKAS